MPDLLPSLPQFLLLVGMGIAILMLWRRSARHFASASEDKSSPHQRVTMEKNREAALLDAPPELTRWQVEMYDTARDLKGEIDTKLVMLQALTRHANEATARLQQAIDRAEKLGLRRALDPLAAIEAWGTTRDGDETPPPEVASGDPAQQAQTQQIYALADAGRNAQAIANETGLPLGDVEMTLSLRAPA